MGVFDDLEDSKYQNIEPRISIYGRSITEWDKLASWAVSNKVYSDNALWLIQVPRLYDIYKLNNQISSFEDIIKTSSSLSSRQQSTQHLIRIYTASSSMSLASTVWMTSQSQRMQCLTSMLRPLTSGQTARTRPTPTTSTTCTPTS